ncbi:MAG: acyl-CoA dehydrogenase family protein, partial [Desulfobacteraceae bacterium]
MADLSKIEGTKCKGFNDFIIPHHLISREIRMFCEVLREFNNKEIIPHEYEFDDYWDWTEREDAALINNIWKKLLIDIGLQQTFIPQELGGMGDSSTVEKCAVGIELSRGDFAVACSSLITPWAIVAAAMPKPNETLLKRFAEELCGDEICLMCSAITEPHAGGSVE